MARLSTAASSNASVIPMGQQLTAISALSAARSIASFNYVVESAGDVLRCNGVDAHEFVPQENVFAVKQIQSRGVSWARQFFDEHFNSIAGRGNIDTYMRDEGIVPERFAIYVEREIISQSTVDTLVKSGMMVDEDKRIGISNMDSYVESMAYTLKLASKDKPALIAILALGLIKLFGAVGYVGKEIWWAGGLTFMTLLLYRSCKMIEPFRKHITQYMLANSFDDPE